MVNKRHKKSIAKRIATTVLAAVLASGSFAGFSTPVYAAENNSGQFFTKDGTVSAPSYNYDNIRVIGHQGSTGNGMEANDTKYWYGNNAFYLLPQKNDGHVNEMVPGLVGSGNQVTAWELADTDATWGGDKFSTVWHSSNTSDASQILGKYESIYNDTTGKYMSKGEKEALVNANIGADYGIGTFKDSHGKVDKTGQNCNINSAWASYSQDIKSNAVKEGVHVFLPSYHEYDSTTADIRGDILSKATATTGKSCVWSRSFWGYSGSSYCAWRLGDSGGSFNGNGVTLEFAAAPAFYLDLTKVVMPREATAIAASGSLASYNPGNPTDVKFLLKTTDWAPSFTVSALSNKEITNAAAGCTYEFSYANAATTAHASSDADKFYISAIIYDATGNIKYYGRLKEITEATGEASITIPSDLSDDTAYTLAIFEEQGSSDHYSDYQSAGVSYSKFMLNDGINVSINSGVTLRDEKTYTKDEIANMVVVTNDHGDVIDKDHYYVLESSVYESLATKDEATISKQEQTVTTEEISTYDGSYPKSVTFISFTGSQPATKVANFTVSADPDAIYTNWVPNTDYQATENGVNWIYRLDENGNIVYLYTTDTNLSSIIDANGNLNLPITIGGLPVIGIGGGDASKPVVPSVSDSWQNVEAITIPYTVQYINECAFYGWKASAKVTIPSTVTTIAPKAFYKSYITELYINGTSAQQIAYRTFANCDNLKVVRITGDTEIGKESFAGCEALANLELDGTITVKPYAFADDTAIKKLYLPSGITLEGYAFSGCSGITDLQLGINKVVDYTFDGCVNIGTLILENTVSKLETNWAGNSGTYAARNIFVYNGSTYFCTSGGDSAFGGHGSVINVYIPNNVSAKGDLGEGNCQLFVDREGTSSPTAKGQATSITFNIEDSIDEAMIRKSVTSVNTLSDVQTGIEAYFSGTLIETLNLDKSKMTVLKRFGTKTNGQYDSSDFYVIRSSDYNTLYPSNVTKEEISKLEPITPTKADLNNQLSNTLAVTVIVFDENGTLGHKLDTEDKSSCYFMAPVSIRIEAYSAESVITGFGSYQSILDKIESLNKEVSELEAKKEEYQSMLDGLNSALAGTGTDEDGNPIDIDTYIKKLEDTIKQIKEASGVETSEEASTKLTQLNTDLDKLKADYDKLADKSSEEAETLKEQIATKEAEIAAMQKVKDQLEAIEQVKGLSEQIASLTKDKNDLANALAEAQENYNNISQELTNLENNYKDKMVGYIGSDAEGNMYVYLDGVACMYDESSAKEEEYIDSDGGKHTVKVYKATDPDGKEFEFFTMLDGIYVKEGSGYKVYEDTLSETLHKANTQLKEIQGELVDLSREISDIYDILNEAGVTVSKGEDDNETMQNIKDAVQDVLDDYKDMKDKYTDIKTAIYGDDLSAEELDKKTISEVVNNIKALSAGLDGVKADIESALSGETISAEDARELATLLDEIKKMKATLDTDADTFTSIKDILNVSDNKDIVDGISNLYKQLDNLSKQVESLNGQVTTLQSTNTALSSSNNDLQKKIEELQAENEALKNGQNTGSTTPSNPSDSSDVDARLTKMQTELITLSSNNSALQSKVDSLSNENMTLQSQLSAIKNTADTASSNASSAKSTADTANSTANYAKTTANNALSTAQSAGNSSSNSGQVSSLQSTVSNLSGKVSALENQNSELQSELAAVKATANTRSSSTTTTNNKKTDNETTTTSTTDTTTMDPDDASVAGNKTATVTAVKDNTKSSTTFTTTTKDENNKLLDSSVIDTTALDGSFNSGEASDNKFNSGEVDEANKLSSDIPVADNTEIEESSGGLSGKGIAILSVLGAGVLGGLGFAGFKLFGGKGKKGNIDLDEFDDENMDIEDPDIDDSDDDDFNF
jgi:DNA repair exonuclease SbcCD ATPase subunit